MKYRVLAAIAFTLILISTAIFGVCTAAPAKPVIEELDVPEKIMVGETINITLGLAGSLEIRMNGHDVFIQYTIGDGSTEYSQKLLYNETTGNWTGIVHLPPYINYTSKVIWKDIQVFEQDNRTLIENTETVIEAPEIESSSWELVLLVAFLGATFVVIEILFKPMRGRSRRDESDEEDPDEEDLDEDADLD